MSVSDTDGHDSTSLELAGRRRRHVAGSELVRAAPYQPELSLPWVIEATTGHVDLPRWAKANRSELEATLCKRGAILLRGFALRSIEDFKNVVAATSDGLVEYTYRASPRTEVSERVYTSTEYPADQSIFPHNEHAFSPVFPRKLFFYCERPATRGGETPLGDGRAIRDTLSASVRQKFLERGVMYVRNYGDHMGLPWETVFQTSERRGVEAYCREHGLLWQWKAGGGLCTRQIGPAFIRHPVTGESVWFNHATFFHVSTLAPAIRDALLTSYAEPDLPNNTYYGDGSPIEPQVLAELRAAYLAHSVTFPWRQGDLLMLDNLLVMHARQPYEGPRRVLVGMADPVAASAVRITAGA